MNDQSKERMRALLVYARYVCDRLELEAGADRLRRFNKGLSDSITADEYRTEVRVLREAVEDELSRRHGMYIKRANMELIENRETEWKNTIAAFPSAEPEVTAAINCLASENSTACVFHLMRAAEHGLRAFAKEQRVILPKGRPIEWADWKEMISAIEKKVKTLASQPRGPARAKALEFYQGLLGGFNAFRDAYRNNVMHTHKHYDEYQAKSLLLNVREFMERLSSRINENTNRRISWSARNA